MRLSTDETRIEGIRKTNTGSWAVVLSYPVGHDGHVAYTLGSEFKGQGAKARAIRAAGTNRVVAATPPSGAVSA